MHLQRSRLPILGDPGYYGALLKLSDIKTSYREKRGQEERPLMPRLALHLSRVALDHPATGERLTIESPLPKHFVVSRKYLRQFAGL